MNSVAYDIPYPSQMFTAPRLLYPEQIAQVGLSVRNCPVGFLFLFSMARWPELPSSLKRVPTSCRGETKKRRLQYEICDNAVATLLKFDACDLRCCRKATFWCSIKGCNYQVCRRCQTGPETMVQRVGRKWVCQRHQEATCCICEKQGILATCFQCHSSACDKHCYECRDESCDYILCRDCQHSGDSALALTHTINGWYCPAH